MEYLRDFPHDNHKFANLRPEQVCKCASLHEGEVYFKQDLILQISFKRHHFNASLSCWGACGLRPGMHNSTTWLAPRLQGLYLAPQPHLGITLSRFSNVPYSCSIKSAIWLSTLMKMQVHSANSISTVQFSPLTQQQPLADKPLSVLVNNKCSSLFITQHPLLNSKH